MVKMLSICKNGEREIIGVKGLENVGNICVLCTGPLGTKCEIRVATKEEVKKYLRRCEIRDD